MIFIRSLLLATLLLASHGEQFEENENGEEVDPDDDILKILEEENGDLLDGFGGDLDGFGGDLDGLGGDLDLSGMEFGNDDLLGGGAISDYGLMMAEMMFGQCLQDLGGGDGINALTDDPAKAIDRFCLDAEASTFNSALDDYKTCSGVDLKKLIENIGSATIGIAISCADYMVDISTLLDDPMALMTADTQPDIPRVPKECVDAFFGDNPLGNFLRNDEEHPKEDMACFTSLGGKLPACTLSEWPVPIVGSWLKAFSCIYGSMGAQIDDQCKKQMDGLSKCLPQEITDSSCKDVINSCVWAAEDDPIYALALPAPFWGPPLAEVCAKNADSSVVERYEKYRKVCIPAEDREIWNAPPKSNKDGNEPVPTETEPSDNQNAEAEELTENIPLTQSSISGGSTSSFFFPGFLTGGIVAALAVVAYNKVKESRTKSYAHHLTYDSLELPEHQFA
jgi:hypothetical protein